MDQSTSLVEFGFRRFIITLVAFVSLSLAAINLYILDSSLDEINRSIPHTKWNPQWISIIYSFGCIVIIPFCTGISVLLGRKNFFLLAIMLFGVFSFCGGNTSNMDALIIFRFCLGIAGGSMIFLSQTVLIESWPTERRGIAQLFVLLAFSSILLARMIGGYITDNYSWRYVFLFNIPWCIILGTFGILFMRDVTYEKQEDWLANLLLMTGAAALFLGIRKSRLPYGENTPLNTALCILGIIGLALFVWRHFHTASQQGKVALLKNKEVTIGLGLGFMTIIGTFIASQYVFSFSRLDRITGEMPLWPIVPLTIVILVTTVLCLTNSKSLKYLIVAGYSLLAIICLLSILKSYTELFWLLMSVTLAGGLLALSLTALTFSKLTGKQVSEGVMLYNIFMKLAITIGGMLAFL